jgi:hypothetical protein
MIVASSQDKSGLVLAKNAREREERLAAALRANLRRRKIPTGAAAARAPEPVPEQD